MRTFKEVLTEYLSYPINTPIVPKTKLEHIAQQVILHAKPSQTALLTFLRDTTEGKPPSQQPVPQTKPNQTITIKTKEN